MEVREQITIEQVRQAKSEMIYYGANTCWWTHDPNHLRVNGRFGPPPQAEVAEPPVLHNWERASINPGSIPTDPRGGVLFQTDDIEGFFRGATSNQTHYGKHGLRAFIAAHHENSIKSLDEPVPWCDSEWQAYNDAIDRMDMRGPQRIPEKS